MAKVDKSFVDPEIARWHKTYPIFPGVAKCLELLNRSNVQGAWVDQICFELEKYAPDVADELIAAFNDNVDDDAMVWQRSILIAIMANTGLPAFQPLFVEQMRSEDERLRWWARVGLERIGTKEARAALWASTQK